MKLTILCAAACLLVSCTAKQSPDTISVQLTSEPVTLDFSLAEDGLALRTLGFMMSGLMKYDGESKLQPEMAESLERVGKSRVWRAKLKDWKWSDGVPVRAQDYVYAIKRTLNPQAPSKLADLLFFIKGALEYKKGTLKDFKKVGVRAKDDRTIEFDLVSEFAFFPHILALTMTLPQREDVVEKFGAAWPRHTPVTGPYRIAEWKSEQVIRLEQNPNYPGFKGPKHVDLRVVADDNTAMNLFESGLLDLAVRVPSLELPRFAKDGRLKEFPLFATYYIAFNQRMKPWNQKAARLAIAASIDREAVVKTLAGGERAAMSWIPREIQGSNLGIGIHYDAARALAAWKTVKLDDEARKNLSLIFDSGAKNQMVAEKIREDLRKTLGIQLEVKNRDWKTHIRELSQGHAPIYRFGYLTVFTDPFASFILFESGNPNNYTGWKSNRYDALLHDIASLAPTDSKRQRLIDAEQKLLLEDDVVAVPIYHYVQRVLVSPRAAALKMNGFGHVDISAVAFQ